MGMSRNCGLSFKITSIAEVIIEILVCSVSVLLSGYAWINQKESIIYLYNGTSTNSHTVTNIKLKACVTYWILTLILCCIVVRLGAILVLAIGLRRNSVLLAKFWIVTKILVLTMSSFLFIVSMTVDMQTRIAAIADFGSQICTSYFICILIPQLEVMAKTIVVKIKEST